MPNVVNPSGILLGTGAAIFSGTGLPAAQTGANILSCSVGSLYLRTDGTAGSVLYVCTVAPIPATVLAAAVPGAWSAVA